MTRVIWDKLKQLLSSKFKAKLASALESARYINTAQKIEYNGSESEAFKGIISQLTKKCGGNVSDKNEVNVTSSSFNSRHYAAKNAVDLEKISSYFASKNEANSWLKYDFKDSKIRPTHYSIRTRHDGGQGENHPQNWVIEGSNTDRDDDWKILDLRNNITVLNDAKKICTFDILSDDEFFRYLRIRQTGTNTGGSYYFNISALEYFGSIV